MRRFYSLMWWLALPLVLGRLAWRARKERGYGQHWGERLGVYGRASAPQRPLIWLHAVSVGETRAAEPLVDALLLAYPGHGILLTHMTPTGRATGQSLFARHGARLQQSYLPYDTGFMLGRFLRHFAPRICILMETEVWPNLVASCARRQVPVALVNARLSERSLRRGQRFGSLITDAARAITLVAAQTQADAQRVRSLGSPSVSVTGSIKFDVQVPPLALQTGAWLRAQFGARPVLLCASTREGEEELILDALPALREQLGDVLLLLVPRHPQRFDDVARMVQARSLTLQRRSGLAPQQTSQGDGVQVLLGDSMGEMFAYYAACDCAFIGGSLLPLGGQNLIEACALGKPVLIGEHTFNFELVTQEAIAGGAATRVADAADLMQQAALILSDAKRRAEMGRQALAFSNQHRGATARTLALLQPLIVG